MTKETWYVPVCPGCFEDMPFEPSESDADYGRQRMVQTWLSDKTMNFDQAQEWAKEQGGRCMTKEEIHLLIACGILKEGGTSFWSSSVYSSSRYGAWIFYGGNGDVNNDYRSYDYSSRRLSHDR